VSSGGRTSVVDGRLAAGNAHRAAGTNCTPRVVQRDRLVPTPTAQSKAPEQHRCPDYPYLVATAQEGLDAARARGQRLGRPPIMTPDKIRMAAQNIRRGHYELGVENK
jgi:hypothetical protein